jgi:biotin operon repressor
MAKIKTPKNRDFRKKSFFQVDDEYMNGYARICGWQATLAYSSLCRHANRDQYCFPSMKLIAEENGVSRDTIIKGIKKLEEWSLIKIHSKRTKKGTFRNNGYDLLDKSEWKKIPSRSQQHGSSKSLTATRPSRSQQHVLKDTHNKDTHILSKDNTKKEFGKPEINRLIGVFKKSFGLPMLDGSEKQNRQFCQLALNKFGGEDKVRLLIEAASKDDFWANKITSFQQLYYKGVQIISKTREVNNGKIAIAD